MLATIVCTLATVLCTLVTCRVYRRLYVHDPHVSAKKRHLHVYDLYMLATVTYMLATAVCTLDTVAYTLAAVFRTLATVTMQRRDASMRHRRLPSVSGWCCAVMTVLLR